MSAASARFTERFPAPTVSYGYDRIRFIKPVFFGDTITVEYRIQSTNASELKAYAQVICTNQRGEVVAVATHLMQLIDGETNESS
jgi:acyl dehydratase